jgi:hypothetical protein
LSHCLIFFLFCRVRGGQPRLSHACPVPVQSYDFLQYQIFLVVLGVYRIFGNAPCVIVARWLSFRQFWDKLCPNRKNQKISKKKNLADHRQRNFFLAFTKEMWGGHSVATWRGYREKWAFTLNWPLGQ